MSFDQDTAKRLSTASLQVFLTAKPAAEVVGITRATLVRYVAPDAWYESTKGDKRHPLWLRSTVEAFRAERDGGAQ